MKYEAVVLLSGGIDSTTCLALAVREYGAENVLALSLLYGQKHQKELDSAKTIRKHYKVDGMIKDVSDVFSLSNCPLLVHCTVDIKHESYARQLKEKQGTIDTYVPFRNGLFLSVATALAVSVGASVIYYGAHADDAAGRAYPDCTFEFVKAMDSAIVEGSGGLCLLRAPFIYLNKADIIHRGLEWGVPYKLTWSCYIGEEFPCGTCGTCIDRIRAFEINGVKDPAYYVKGGK